MHPSWARRRVPPRPIQEGAPRLPEQASPQTVPLMGGSVSFGCAVVDRPLVVDGVHGVLAPVDTGPTHGESQNVLVGI